VNLDWQILLLGIALGVLPWLVWSWGVPLWQLWREENIETKEDRQFRRLRRAIEYANSLCDSGLFRRARRVMFMVLWFNPNEPDALHAMGQVQAGLEKPRIARHFFLKAYKLACRPEAERRKQCTGLAAEIAVDDAHACAALRLMTANSTEREQWAEAILDCAIRAGADDMETATELLKSPILADLRAQIELALRNLPQATLERPEVSR
jgi:hypothetical protein